MYSFKGSWVGQTFALATPSDSGAKKSRIRRSKEERKSMVESFIKRYQSSNNGNFPSLNLTHKEVGGSFYTVREIVREIIQENRVLGPGQISSEEQIDVIAVNHPLGTISSEPQGRLIQNAIDLNVISSEGENKISMMNLDTNGQYTKIFDKGDVQNSTQNSEFQTDDGLTCESTSENLVISDHQEQMNSEESLKCNENETDNVHLVEFMETDGIPEKPVKLFNEESELLGAFHAPVTLPTQEVEVETFPLKPTFKETVNLSSTPTDSLCSDRDSEDQKFQKSKLSNINQLMDKDKFSSSETSDVVTPKEANDFESSGSVAHPDMSMTIKHEAVNNTQINLKDESVDMPYSIPIKDDNAVLHDCTSRISAHGDTTSETSELKNIQMQPKNTSRTAIYSENSSGTSCKTVKEPTVIHGNDLKKDEKFMAGSSPPLDRIDLESWRATKQKNNPLLAFVKACVDAFIRFWSE